MRINVAAKNGKYDILIGKDLVASKIADGYPGYAVITDENVFGLYGHFFEKDRCIVLKAGEQSKSLQNYGTVLDALLEMGVDRSSAVIALGGGVIGDLAGFAAATFKRGVPLIQIPTTLLAQVDSSVGGKVAVNLQNGKNIVGAFYQPKLVVIDTDTLNTLDERQYNSGMSEVIKYAFIADSALYETVLAQEYDIEAVIACCCGIKARYVEEDPFDTGVRMQLNYGHTVGHAIEAAAGYGAYLHGEAVAAGMVYAAYLGERLAISPVGLMDQTKQILEQYHLPQGVNKGLLDSASQLLQADKKAEGGKINFVFIDAIGHAVTEKIEVRDIKVLLGELAL